MLLDSRKKKADGTYSIYFRVTEYKKVLYIHSGFSVHKELWDEDNKAVKKGHPNASSINASLTKKFLEIQKAVIKLDDEGIFSFDSLKEKLSSKKQLHTIAEYSEMLIQQMLKQRKTGNALVYRTATNSLFSFKPSKSLKFTDITVRFLNEYQSFLIDKGNGINTISNYLRTIRAIFNKAIKEKIVDRHYYPFNDFSIKSEKTSKRAINKADITAIEQLELPIASQIKKARDLFLLSFYLIGISFTDLAYLKTSSIENGRLIYKRRKTGKIYNILIHEKASNIINDYKSGSSKYLFTVIPDEIIEDSLDAKKLIFQWIKTTNKYLERISNLIGINSKITTYVARHTWATTAKRLGYSNELIAEAMGHEYGNATTNIYLDSFDKTAVDTMNEKVIFG